MTAYQYAAIYDALRNRIEAGEFGVGDRLPSISALQEEYDVPSLGTIRAAQQMLVEDGMIRTEQGRGAFVVSVESARSIDPDDALSKAVSHISRARAALTAQAIRRVAFDLDATDDTYYVLTSALEEWQSRCDFQAEEEESPLADDLRRWAAHARNLLDTIEAALNREAQEEEGR